MFPPEHVNWFSCVKRKPAGFAFFLSGWGVPFDLYPARKIKEICTLLMLFPPRLPSAFVMMIILLIYITTNVAAPCFAPCRKELGVLPHVLAPVLSTLLLLLSLASYILPAILGAIVSFLRSLVLLPPRFPQTSAGCLS